MMITGSTPWSITIDVGEYFFVARGEWTLEPKFYLDHFERDGVREYSLEKIREYKRYLSRETAERGWIVEVDEA
ncbi:MAG: hypothetical protein EOP84_29925 [Verrucomicrobiaceae bacterium]|nr:MAG: hypothetical protein EOP84_29925 [Verrucomicrobiaceae bacterium]